MISPAFFSCFALLHALCTDQAGSRIIYHVAAWIIFVFCMIAITASRRGRNTHLEPPEAQIVAVIYSAYLLRAPHHPSSARVEMSPIIINADSRLDSRRQETISVERLGQPYSLDFQDVDSDARINLRAGGCIRQPPKKAIGFSYRVLPIGCC